MDIKQLKDLTNSILSNKNSECSYIEYKSSEKQLDKILKTICAYGNNLYLNRNQFIFIGVEEENNEISKAVPKLPIVGIKNERLEKVTNVLKSLKSYIYPNVKYEVIANNLNGSDYLFIYVPEQNGGPFTVTEKALNDKHINLKPGRYIRVDFETRIATIQEEYELIRKFANYSFDEDINKLATIDDLSIDIMNEFIDITSERKINKSLNKEELIRLLKVTDKNDPNNKSVYNFAVLMFSENPEKFIKSAYIDLIVDVNGSKKMMEEKVFKGPIWKQYSNVTNYIKNNYLNTIVVRKEDEALNKKVSNYSFTAIEELVANAIVHNDYQNNQAIQIYITETEITIVNYNNPLPPLTISDLNERTFFNERNTINPYVRDLFKQLHIIESFGTGIGEAKRATEVNGSPSIYYKEFNSNSNVTSVVIPINQDYYKIKVGNNLNKKPGFDTYEINYQKIINSKESNVTKNKLITIINNFNEKIFGNHEVSNLLSCSETTATKYIKLLVSLEIIISVEGFGKGKYKIRSLK